MDRTQTQEQRILRLLQSSYPSWVPASALSRISLQHNARIFPLRRKGWEIANRIEVQPNGAKHAAFSLASPGALPNPKRRIAGDEFNRATPLSEGGLLFGEITREHDDRG
jgi:hypothetical protein